MLTKRSTTAALLAFGLALAIRDPRPASAQPKRDPAAADEAFRAAIAAKLAGDLQTACAKFGASMSLDPAPSTLLNVAECLEREGKLALAWSETQRAQVLNTETPGDQRRQELDTYAATMLERLRRKLAWVRIVMADPPPGVAVERDGLVLPTAMLDQPIPADPGKSRVTATAPGHVPFALDLALSEGKTTEVTITLPAGGAAAETAPLPSGAASAGPRPVWPWISGGVGLALLGVGVAFAISQAGVQSDIDASCHEQPDGRCLQGYPYQAKNDALYRDFGLSLGFGIAGAVATAAGVLGLALSPRGTRTAAGQVGLTPVLGPDAGGLILRGAF